MHYSTLAIAKDEADMEAVLAPYDENVPYNPIAQWDWYEVGGRWQGALVLKDGKRASAARVADIDLEAMGRLDELFYAVVGPWAEWAEVQTHEQVRDFVAEADPDAMAFVVDCHT